MAARVSALAWMLAMSQRKTHACPSLLGFSTLSNVAVSCRIVVVVARGECAPARVAPARWTPHDLHQHVKRATVHAEGDRECRGLLCVALQLSLLDAAAAPSGLMHREEAAGGLVDVHDAVCADSALVHEPVQFDEQPGACWPLAEQGLWSSFKHLAGFLKLSRMPRRSSHTHL